MLGSVADFLALINLELQDGRFPAKRKNQGLQHQMRLLFKSSQSHVPHAYAPLLSGLWAKLGLSCSRSNETWIQDGSLLTANLGIFKQNFPFRDTPRSQDSTGPLLSISHNLLLNPLFTWTGTGSGRPLSKPKMCHNKFEH